jgi:DNA-binding response OmpR family regulator
MESLPRRVLIVEDDPSVQRALERFLDVHGFSAVTVADADVALDIVREGRLAAAIVDLHLPHGSGRDVVVSIPAPIPVIIFSGMPEDSCDLEHLRPHTRLIEKPYSLVMLVEMLERMLAGDDAAPPGQRS